MRFKMNDFTSTYVGHSSEVYKEIQFYNGWNTFVDKNWEQDVTSEKRLKTISF